MDNKLSELRHLTPRQIAVYRDRVAISDSDYELIPVHTGDLRALLAELEAKDKRIAELERANTSQDDHINQQQDRIESLEKTNARTVVEQNLVIKGGGRGCGYTADMRFDDFPACDSEREAALKLADWMQHLGAAIEDHWSQP
ncbi:hypothetical protein [Serratia sarumanii]|uniref:hypothetical protein n=1 Tax=Serratia sarumanii TaxID=3020826 RepID=UPI003F6CB477